MFIKEIRSFIKRAILLFLLAASLIIFGNALLQRPYVQKEILKRISTAIGYDIEAKDIEINLWGGLGISINNLSAESRQGNKRFSALNVRFDLDAKQLLAGRIVPTSFYLNKPIIELPWEKGYNLNIDLKGLLPEKIPFFSFPEIRSLIIEQGHVTFIGASFTLDEFYFRAVRTGFSTPLEFMTISRGQVEFKGKKAGFEVNGRITTPSSDSSPLLVNVKVRTDNAPLTWLKWPAPIPLKDGYFKTKLDVEGDPAARLSIRGMIDLSSLEFELLRKDKYKNYLIPEITLDFQSVITNDNIEARSVKISGDDLSIDLGLALNLKNKRSPLLDLNFNSEFMDVETFKTLFPSPLLPLWLEKRLFPILTDGEIRVNNFSLKGGIDQIRHMQMPENRSVMELLFECRGFVVSGDGIRLPFKDVSAEIGLKEGLFSVSGLKAGFGDSIIKDAGLNIRDVFDVSRFYEICINGDLDIKDLLSQRDMDVVSVKASGRIDKWPDMTGRLSGKTTIGYQRGWACPRILNGDFLLNGFSVDKKEFVFPVRFEEASIHIDDAGADYISGAGSWGNSSFNLSANFGITNMAPYFKDGLLSADMDMNQVFSAFNLKGRTPLAFSDTLLWDVSLAKNEGDWSLKGHVNPRGTIVKSGDFIVKSTGRYNDNIVFELGIKSNDNRIDIKNVLLNLKDSSINMTAAYDIKTRRFNNISLHSSELSVKDISVAFDKREIFTGGVLKGDMNISMEEEAGSPVVAGHAEGAALSFQTGIHSMLINDCSFQADFSKDGIRVNSFNMTTGKSNFFITGNVKGWREPKGDLKVRSDYLDFSDIMPGEGASSYKNIMDHLNLLIQMDVSKGQWRRLSYGPAQAELVFENGNLFVKDSRVHLDHGDLGIKGHILKAPNPEMFFSGDIHIKDQPVDKIMEDVGISYSALKGSIAVDGSLSIKGKEKKGLLSGLNGSVNVSLKQGLIKNPSVFVKVLDFLSLQKIFEQRPPDLKGEGLYFESISGDAVIENGVLTSDNMVMRSPVMNAVADGKADIPRKNVDFILGVQPHGTIDSLISKVPILGYIVTGENKSIVAYPFDVKGSFADPDVKFVPFETLEGGVVGIMKRILLTPARIFNKIDKALENNGKNPGP